VGRTRQPIPHPLAAFIRRQLRAISQGLRFWPKIAVQCFTHNGDLPLRVDSPFVAPLGMNAICALWPSIAPSASSHRRKRAIS
jgi:hypothetical protein